MWLIYCTKCPSHHIAFHYFARVWTQRQALDRANLWANSPLTCVRLDFPKDVIIAKNDEWEFVIRSV